jgi:hypothetical protein
VVGSPLRSVLVPQGCEPWEAMVRVARWAVCEVSPFGPTPAPTRQHQHASNSSGYDYSPMAEANGNRGSDGILLEDTAWHR